MEQVVKYYWRMARENGLEHAMAFTLEMFEGLTAAQVDRALADRDMDGNLLDEINQRIDRIAPFIDRAETLNALHACRPGHPLGRDNGWKWRNAAALVHQSSYLERHAIGIEPIRWLDAQAQAEGAAK